MAQRIYLVPVPPDVVRLFCAAVSADSDADLDEALQSIRARAEGHKQLDRLSKRTARRLDEQAFERAGRIDDYRRYVGLRPYVVTADEPDAVVAAVGEARRLRSEAEVAAFFDAQVATFARDLFAAAPGAEEQEEDEQWKVIATDLPRLRAMRTAAVSGHPLMIEQRKQMEMAGLQVLTEEMEAIELTGPDLAETYGALASYTLARTAAYCEPTWWLGRDFWPGLLLTVQFGITRWFKRSLRGLQKDIAAHASSPATLLGSIAVPGFEAGLHALCGGYATGLYFGAEAVPGLLSSLRANRGAWTRLAHEATGYPSEATTELVRMVEEALAWAAGRSVGLLEADEVVGMYGYR